MKPNGFSPISNHPTQLVPTNKTQKTTGKQGFATHFQTAIEASTNKLSISKHAQTRLDQRNIHIDQPTWAKIAEKVKEAKKMGVTDSLVITNDAALVISAKNNTVITAMDRVEATAQIFTNINGTILLD